jgi:hypothetical protein
MRYLKSNGSALLAVTVVLVILMIVSVAILSLGHNTRTESLRNSHSIAARIAADAGLEKTLYDMNTKLGTGAWSDSALPAGSETMTNSLSSFKYTVTGDLTNGHKVVSVGQHRNALHKVIAQLQLVGLFEFALVVRDRMELKHGTTIDGYNFGPDDRPLEIATGNTAAGSIDMKSGVTVDGDVLAGFGGDPDTVINTKSANTIKGDTYSMAHLWDPPIIAPPDYLVAAPSGGPIAAGMVITKSGKYDSLRISNGQKVVIDGRVEIYITGDIILDNSAIIEITNTNPDANLDLYLGGNFEQKNGGAVNNLTMDPQKMTLYGQGNCLHVDFKTDGDFYGAIYAPNADVVLHNSVEFFGAVVADEFVQMVNADFHFDASLRTIGTSDIGVRFIQERWSEE